MILEKIQILLFQDVFIECEEKAIFIMKYQDYQEACQKLLHIHPGTKRLE